MNPLDADLDLQVQWHHGYANAPCARITLPKEFDEYFSYGNPIWKQTPDKRYCYAFEPWHLIGHYIAAKNTGILPRSSRAFLGFGGAHFHIKLKHGGAVTTNNAWSGDAQAFSRCLGEPNKYLELSVRYEPKSVTYIAGFVIHKTLLKQLLQDQGYYLLDPLGIISSHPKIPDKPQQKIRERQI